MTHENASRLVSLLVLRPLRRADISSAVADAEPENLKNKMHLAKVYEALGDHAKALVLINEG